MRNLALCRDRPVDADHDDRRFPFRRKAITAGRRPRQSAALALIVPTGSVALAHIDVTLLAEILFRSVLGGLAAAGISTRTGGRRPDRPATDGAAGETWTVPQLELLERPEWSRTRTAGMYALRGYLGLAVVMLVAKAIKVGIGH
jgi:hypothetical protein